MNRSHLLPALLVLYLAAIAVALIGLWPGSRFHHSTGAKKIQEGSVAVVHIYGPISTSLSASPWISSDADEIARTLHRLSEDDQVKAILLRINSPGGTVGAVQNIYEEIQRCKAKGKKVVASLGDVAASGGYYLASAADRIVAEPGTITGSIGVILEFGDLEGLFQKLGVHLEVVKSGAHKDIGSPARALTPEERQMLQASINDAYGQFLNAVAQGRKMTVDQVRPIADGRIFTGGQAKAAGLVDQLGNNEDALKLAIQLADLPPHPPIISDVSKSVYSLIRQLSGMSRSGVLASLAGYAQGPQLEYLLQ